MDVNDPRWERRPRQITIFSRTYEIEWHDGRFLASDGEACHGECLNETQVLRISYAGPPATVAELLVHEAGHALYYMMEGDQIKREEEDAVNLSGMAVITIAKLNPGLLTWLDDMAR